MHGARETRVRGPFRDEGKNCSGWRLGRRRTLGGCPGGDGAAVPFAKGVHRLAGIPRLQRFVVFEGELPGGAVEFNLRQRTQGHRPGTQVVIGIGTRVHQRPGRAGTKNRVDDHPHGERGEQYPRHQPPRGRQDSKRESSRCTKARSSGDGAGPAGASTACTAPTRRAHRRISHASPVAATATTAHGPK